MSGFNSIASEFHVQEKVMRVRDCARARPVTRCGAGRSVLRTSNDRPPTPDLQDIQETSGLLATLFFSLAHIILGLMLQSEDPRSGFCTHRNKKSRSLKPKLFLSSSARVKADN